MNLTDVSVAHFASIVQTESIAIITSDKSGLIKSWNVGAENIFQYSASLAIGKPITMIIPKQYQERHNNGIANILKGGKGNVLGRALEIEGIRNGGEAFPIELTLGMSKDQGKYYFSAIIRDISKRRETERAAAKHLREVTSLQDLIKQYTPMAVWGAASKAIEFNLLELPSERKMLTYMFCDIKGFTSFSETLNAEQVINYINDYFSTAAKIIVENNGDIESFRGDAFFAVFEDSLSALRASVKIVNAFRIVDKDRKAASKPELKFRIGIHEGIAVRGNVGGSHRKEHTVIGSAVNLASRLEGHCRVGGILISDFVYQRNKENIKVTRKASLSVKGIEKNIYVRYLTGVRK